MTSLAVFHHQVGRGALSIGACHYVAAYRRPRRHLRAWSRVAEPPGCSVLDGSQDYMPRRRGSSALFQLRTDREKIADQLLLRRSRCKNRCESCAACVILAHRRVASLVNRPYIIYA